MSNTFTLIISSFVKYFHDFLVIEQSLPPIFYPKMKLHQAPKVARSLLHTTRNRFKATPSGYLFYRITPPKEQESNLIRIPSSKLQMNAVYRERAILHAADITRFLRLRKHISIHRFSVFIPPSPFGYSEALSWVLGRRDGSLSKRKSSPNSSSSNLSPAFLPSQNSSEKPFSSSGEIFNFFF